MTIPKGLNIATKTGHALCRHHVETPTSQGLIPPWAWVSWMVVVGSAILVSILWVSIRWAEGIRERSHQAQKKVG
ncbi:hypothetical protein Peur_055434 [Populus x canadensis]